MVSTVYFARSNEPINTIPGMSRHGYVFLAILNILTFLHIITCQGDEMEWRHEAQEVAQEALAQKYPQLITSESDMELFRYSTPSVLQRSAHAFTYIVTPKGQPSNTYRCDVIISRYKGQRYSFVFGEPSCFKVECTNETVANKKKKQKFCRKV
ncbi:uncharacterized protein LOC111260021 isoform X2 [Varroa jacobsoni]|uniref:uncharacterized protein LOC111260021 isoform X2 n=1 Tax=Varroa jacobsoni TaxID=62625 RepID=UPI000BF2E8DF|nr:uncharacterized protein LOC111260021 isoform X2 [Varroa jacobsoni]